VALVGLLDVAGTSAAMAAAMDACGWALMPDGTSTSGLHEKQRSETHGLFLTLASDGWRLLALFSSNKKKIQVL